MRYAAVLLGITALLVLVAGLLWSSAVLAQPNYDLPRYVVAGGGGQLQAGVYTLGGTAGQPATRTTVGGDYLLCSGFWCGAGAMPAAYRIYLPLVLRAFP